MSPTQQGGREHHVRFGLAAGVAAIAAGLWLLATWTVHLHELLVGVGVVIASTLFLTRVFAEELHQYAFRFSDVGACWRLPWYVLSSSWEIVSVLWRDLAGNERAPSIYRVCGFQTSKNDPLMVARRALATAYTSVAPNFIVIGIDYHRSRMLFHQVRRSSVPAMTKELGAQVSHDPTRHMTVDREPQR